MTAKEQLRSVLDELPDEASLEDIVHEFYLRSVMERGIDDVETGRLIPHEEVKRDFLQRAGASSTELDAKEQLRRQVHQLADALTESATWDDVLYAVYMRQAIDEGLADIDAGRTVSHEEVKREFLK